MSAAALLPREPLERRTRQPVHRRSFLAGECEAGWWTPLNGQELGLVLQAAEIHDHTHKQPGDRDGPIGYRARRVLAVLWRAADYRSGRLDLAIVTIAARAKLAVSTVVKALKRLQAVGLVDWKRRLEWTGERGARGPQVRQVSNAYRLSFPDALRRLLPSGGRKPPPPDDTPDHEAARQAMVRAQPLGERGAAMVELGAATPKLGASLDQLAAAIARRKAGAAPQTPAPQRVYACGPRRAAAPERDSSDRHESGRQLIGGGAGRPPTSP